MHVRGAAAAALLLVAVGAHAATPPPGAFRLTAGSVTPIVSSWGPHCGPAQPGLEHDAPGVTYQLGADGGLAATGRARPLFEPGVCARATGLRGLIETRPAPDVFRCASAPDSGKDVKGEIRLQVVNANSIEITQNVDYDWTLKGSHCVVRMEGRWSLMREEPVAVDPCATPGPLARLKVVGQPARRVRTEGQLRLETRGEDAHGCVVPAEQPAWTASAGEVDATGLFTPKGLDVGARATVTAAAPGAEPATWTVTVVAAGAPLDEQKLVAAGPDLPATEVAPVSVGPAAGVGAGAGASAPDPQPSRLLLLVFVVFAVVAAGLALYVAWRTLRRPSPARDPLSSGGTPVSNEGRVCPRCGTRYGLDDRFCGRDGAALVPSDQVKSR
jgi:hypothetical protein